MAQELTMPKLSDSTADAVIVRWLKSPGDSFQRGDGLIEVETDKATVVYEAVADGTLDAILVPEGGAAAVGEPIATVSNGEGGGAATEKRRGQAKPAPAPARPAPLAPSGDGQNARQPNATPVARRRAVELGVSLHGLMGTGPGGRITIDDVTKAAAEGEGAAPEDALRRKGETRVLELTTTQATIARRMVESATTIPVFSVSADIDTSRIAELRGKLKDLGGDDVPTLNDFLVKAAAGALREFPRFNASYVDGKVECYSRVNVGVAVATDDALLVPVVFDADLKTLAQVAADTRRLADAARRRALTPEDLHDGTFTVTNLGMFDVRSFTAIIDPPQVAILAAGSARREPVEDGPNGLTFRDAMTVTLTGDHRVVYGADGARFLSRLRELLEQPDALAVDATTERGR